MSDKTLPDLVLTDHGDVELRAMQAMGLAAAAWELFQHLHATGPNSEGLHAILPILAAETKALAIAIGDMDLPAPPAGR